MIRVLFCGPDSKSGGVSNHTKNLSKNLSKIGVDIIFYKFKGSWISKIYNRTFGLLVQSVIHWNEYDIIHVQCSAGSGSFPSALFGAFAAYVLSKKFIFTYHNSDILYPKLFKFCLIRSNKIIFVSHFQKSIVAKYYPECLNKIVVLPNGYDETKFFPQNQKKCRQILGLPHDKKIVLTIGGLLQVKGHHSLIEAMNLVLNVHKDIICVIIGEGPLKNNLLKHINSLSLENNIRLVGEIDNSIVSIWLNACDLFVLPSINEGNPTVMFESLACGKPFVGTTVGGIPEIIVSDKYGLLVKSNMPSELSEKIIDGLSREWDYNAISQYADRFKWQKIAYEVKRIYENF